MTVYCGLFRFCTAVLFAIGFIVEIHAYSITSPVSGDTLYWGNDFKITWNSDSKKSKDAFLELFQGEKSVLSIGAVPDKEKFKWAIPRKLPASNSYRLKIFDASQPNPSVFAMSDSFTILPPKLTIFKPDMHTVWQVGNGYNSNEIRFEKTGVRGLVRIDLYKHRKLIHTFSTGTFYKSGYSAQFPDGATWPPSAAYRIKLTSTDDASIFCISEPFTINNINRTFPLYDVGLQWTPKVDEYQDLGASRIQNLIIALGPFTDTRKDSMVIGRGTEYGKKRFVTTDESVAQWCREKIANLMQNNKINVDSLHSGIVISGKVLDFCVIEESSYNAMIRIDFTAISKSGEQIWEKPVTGKATNWGTSYKIENYYECLSDAMINLAQNLLSDPTFQRDVGGVGR